MNGNVRPRKYLRDGRAPIPKSPNTSKVMSAIRAKNTGPELIVRNALSAAGLKGYRLHWSKVPGRPDIAFPGRKIAIFVHGCFWHRCPYCNPSSPKTNKRFWYEKFRKNTERDKQKTKLLRKAGWKVFVFWECRVKKDPKKLADKVLFYITQTLDQLSVP